MKRSHTKFGLSSPRLAVQIVTVYLSAISVIVRDIAADGRLS